MRCPLKKILAMSILSIGIVTTSHSAFIDESSANPFSTNARLKIRGDFEDKVIYGFAQDMNLADAAQQIAPAGFHVRFHGVQEADTRKVSWQGGKGWSQVLREMLSSNPDLSALIDGNSKLVVIATNDAPEDDIRLATNGSGTFQGSVADSSTPTTSVKPLPPTWEVRSGAYLRATLDEWAMRAGWSFVWGLPEDADFRFGAGNSYVNEFKGAVTDLINSLPPTVRIRVELRTDNMPPLLYVTSQGEGK